MSEEQRAQWEALVERARMAMADARGYLYELRVSPELLIAVAEELEAYRATIAEEPQAPPEGWLAYALCLADRLTQARQKREAEEAEA